MIIVLKVLCWMKTPFLYQKNRISNYLDESARRIIYNSFVSSNFNCCPFVWHFCGVTDGNKIEKIQERCLRIIYKDYESSYDRLLDRENTTKLAISRLRILILEVFKSIHRLNPKCISDLFEFFYLSFYFKYIYTGWTIQLHCFSMVPCYKVKYIKEHIYTHS